MFILLVSSHNLPSNSCSRCDVGGVLHVLEWFFHSDSVFLNWLFLELTLLNPKNTCQLTLLIRYFISSLRSLMQDILLRVGTSFSEPSRFILSFNTIKLIPEVIYGFYIQIIQYTHGGILPYGLSGTTRGFECYWVAFIYNIISSNK